MKTAALTLLAIATIAFLLALTAAAWLDHSLAVSIGGAR